MKDVTPAVMEYRDAAVQLWNRHYRTRVPALSVAESPLLDDFEQIDGVLFRSLVLTPMGRRRFIRKSSDEPLPFLVVRPRHEQVLLYRGRRGTPHGNVVWNEAVPAGAEVAAVFVEIFDWDRYGVRTGALVRARLVDAAPDHAGEVLLALDDAIIEATEGG